MIDVKYKALVEFAAPTQAHDSDAGWDLPLIDVTWLQPGVAAKLRTGLAFELPPDHFGDVRPRSSAILRSIHVAGTLDEQYRGELFVLATNLTHDPIRVGPDKRIAQLIVLPRPRVRMLRVDELADGERADRGFGSSDKAVG